ncbi:MAG TPA: molybdenum ABC transporter ATP-binding protein [Hyphomicrobiales bacterium]|nr:molybdenum ABC transporter ATP-binding protein [Hyphomicrobiales bacterium]
MLEIAVRRRVGGFALDAAFAVPPGVTALVGASGAGKSTIVALAAGLARPDAGRIVLNGRTLFDGAAGIDVPPHRRAVRVVFQESRLMPHLSVRSNLLFGRRRVTPRPSRPSLEEVVVLLGIEGLLPRRPRSLSGGERQRVAIGRALLAGPEALLFDEPLAALDAARKAEILPFLERLVAATALPILYVTHALEEAERLAQRLVVLAEGKVVADGPFAETAARAGVATAAERLAAATELVATVSGHDEAYRLTLLALGRHRLTAPGVFGRPGDEVHLRILARDVIVAREAPQAVSIRNALPGTVRTVVRGDGAVAEVAIDIGGAVLRAEITRKAADELDLAPGRAVYALVKSVVLAEAIGS